MSVCWWTILTRSAHSTTRSIRAVRRASPVERTLWTRQRSQGQQTLPPWFLHLGSAELKPRPPSVATHYKYLNSKQISGEQSSYNTIQLSNRWRMHRITFQGLLMNEVLLISTFKSFLFSSRAYHWLHYINDLQWTRKQLKSTNQGLRQSRECSSEMKMETSFFFSHSWPSWHLWLWGHHNPEVPGPVWFNQAKAPAPPAQLF